MICMFKVMLLLIAFRKKCIEIYELDPAHFLSALGLAWQACLKKTSKIRIINVLISY